MTRIDTLGLPGDHVLLNFGLHEGSPGKLEATPIGACPAKNSLGAIRGSFLGAA
jgi:hypothetical protein